MDRYTGTKLPPDSGEGGRAIVKACTLPDGNIRYYPEYENVAELAERNQLSFRETYDRIRSYWTTER